MLWPEIKDAKFLWQAREYVECWEAVCPYCSEVFYAPRPDWVGTIYKKHYYESHTD